MSSADEIARLKAKLAARRSNTGYERNIADIEKRIAELEGRDGLD